MKVFASKFILYFVLIVLPTVGLLSECQGNNIVTSISIDRFFYKNGSHNPKIIERHYASISLTNVLKRNSNSNSKRRKKYSNPNSNSDCDDSRSNSNSKRKCKCQIDSTDCNDSRFDSNSKRKRLYSKASKIRNSCSDRRKDGNGDGIDARGTWPFESDAPGDKANSNSNSNSKGS